MSEAASAVPDEKPLRLTESVRKALLAANEGFRDSTYSEGKNFREQRDYEVIDGELHIRSRSKTSWADSRRDDTYIADSDTTHRFLRNNLFALNTDGVREHAAEMEPELRAARKEARKTEAEAEAPAAREADAAESARPADDDVETGGLSTAQKVGGALAIGGLIYFGHKAWTVKIKSWRDARRARRAAERQAELGEGSQPPDET